MIRKLLAAALIAALLPAYAGAQTTILRRSDNSGPVPADAQGLAVKTLDGQNVAFGAKADPAATNDTGAWSSMALQKRLLQQVAVANGYLALMGTPLQAGGSIGNTQFGVTQVGGWGVTLLAGSQVVGAISNTGFAVNGSLPGFASPPTFNLGTLNGAALASKQPAFGVAGSSSPDVYTFQGIAGGTPVPMSATALPLPGGASNSVNQDAERVLLGALNETPPSTDTASSGLNGRMARMSQRMTALETLITSTNTKLDTAITKLTSIDTRTADVQTAANSTTPPTVTINQATPGTTNRVAADHDKVGGTAVLTGTGNNGPGAQRVAQGFVGATTYPINISTATTVEIIPANGSLTTYIVFAKLQVDGTSTVTWKNGTGTNCGTGTATQEGPYNLTAQAGWAEGNGSGVVMTVPAGKALCATTTAAVQHTGRFLAVQF